jgi:hypothetical protein
MPDYTVFLSTEQEQALQRQAAEGVGKPRWVGQHQDPPTAEPENLAPADLLQHIVERHLNVKGAVQLKQDLKKIDKATLKDFIKDQKDK